MFLLAKSKKYYYDADAIREQLRHPGAKGTYGTKHQHAANPQYSHSGNEYNANVYSGRNKRDVWHVVTEPLKIAHFAAFGKKWIEPCILAGSSHKACGGCGSPWVRLAEKVFGKAEAPRKHIAGGDTTIGQGWEGTPRRAIVQVNTLGWQPTCKCDPQDDTGKSIVLDPFMGSGTTAIVAANNGRDYIGIDASEEYCEMARKRIAEETRQMNFIPEIT
jgi:2-polyprenyl-3-methyl-5-hydroxy-6-metoxy-1,4-benzoquinol methylase